MSKELSLEDLINGVTKTSKKKDTSKHKTVEILPSCPKIPMSERKFSTIFLKELKAPEVEVKHDKGRLKKAFISAYLSINPQYEYLYSTKSIYFSKRQYVFLDKSRNIKVVCTFEEIEKVISEYDRNKREETLEDIINY